MPIALVSTRMISVPTTPPRTPLARNKWLRCPRPDPAAGLRLWCAPFAGGGAAVWHPWSAPLAGAAEVIAFCLPGREDRLGERPFARTSQVVDALAGAMAGYTHERYVLCGHSLGALLVFELARRLRERGLGAPRAVIVSGARAPHLAPPQPLLHHMPRHDFIAHVERRYGSIPPEIRDHPDFLDLLLPTLRADLEVYETHQHTPAAPLDVPVLALSGIDDHIVTEDDVLAWSEHTTARFEVEFLPGGHFFLQDHFAPTINRVRSFLQTL